MKRIIPLLFPLLFLGCKKNQYCWKCETTATNYINSPPTIGITSTILCDKTAGEITDYQKQASSITTYKVGNSTYSIVVSTKCNVQK